jgi:hypothetical protein
VPIAPDVELAKQRMLQAQEALLRYADASDRDEELHKTLIQELRNSTRLFLDRVEQLVGIPKVQKEDREGLRRPSSRRNDT